MDNDNAAGRYERLSGSGHDSSGKQPSQMHSRTNVHTSQPVWTHSRKYAGSLEDGWLVKRGLRPEVHMMRAPRGWATDAAHLAIHGLRGVRIVTVDGVEWTASIETWQRYGVPINRGHGPQVVLCERYWTVRRPGLPPIAPALSVQPDRPPSPQAAQLALACEVR